jgi:hypothetical protein
MGAAKRQQKYKSAEAKAVKATSTALGSQLRANRAKGDPRLEENRSRDNAASREANAVKDSLKAPSTKIKNATPKDRANDSGRVSNHEEDRDDYFGRKFGYELANPQPDIHEAEYDEANKRL